ncbi:hypothetical protein IEQ34_014260 [Dendrobium chrysotoxum]|uniref:Uncharacterized protein n=1 Tax=Dendrobium chrysotoxum TaxID=161865 RepID=A0AAV7GL57_DENCH|nr:hypothetical protein IEQ34_014260 [Dendrobium chrysotoxum]
MEAASFFIKSVNSCLSYLCAPFLTFAVFVPRFTGIGLNKAFLKNGQLGDRNREARLSNCQRLLC